QIPVIFLHIYIYILQGSLVCISNCFCVFRFGNPVAVTCLNSIPILCKGPVSQRCLCRKVRDKNFGGIKSVEDVQIFPPSQSCTRLEIIVSLKNGVQYCLDPKMKIVQNLLTRLMNKPAPPTVPSPTEVP
uniref:Chemokine interleukin-8-like domain-containing protein n=1 Tax=Esox lucius TaxID=8010 RepID=A0A3P8YHE7_ESOLU